MKKKRKGKNQAFFPTTGSFYACDCYIIRGFTLLPLISLPSSDSNTHKLALDESSPTFATYSKSSVNMEGQLIFKCSNPSVCITAAKPINQTIMRTLASKNIDRVINNFRKAMSAVTQIVGTSQG